MRDPLKKCIVLYIGLVVLALAVPKNAMTKHIIGGEITYECLGGGDFRFQMNVYRDCAGSGASFDNPAVITIYRQSGNNYRPFFYRFPRPSPHRDPRHRNALYAGSPGDLRTGGAVYL